MNTLNLANPTCTNIYHQSLLRLHGRLQGGARRIRPGGVGAILKMLILVAFLTTIGSVQAASASSPTIRESNQMALVKDQTHTGSHRTMDYRIEFTYTFQPGEGGGADSLQFEGRITPRRGLNTFLLRLHLLDDGGHVLGTSILYAPGAGRGAGRPTISRTIEVPAGTEKIGFSHVARERRRLPGRR